MNVGPVPQEISQEALITLIWNIFQQIESEFYFLRVPAFHVEPNRPLDGQLAYADGTHWNPGAGKGAYMWDATGATWRFLG